jgi:hypothetical protein
MKKLILVSSVFVVSVFNSSAQVQSNYCSEVNSNDKIQTLDINEQEEPTDMIMLPSFSQLPQANQKIIISEQKEKLLKRYEITHNTADDNPNLKLAGGYIEKAGNQLVAGAVVPLVSTAFGLLLILVAGSSTSSSTAAANSGIALVGGVVVLGGAIAGVALNISGASNLAKAGRVLKGESVY